jgi:hypothetical protein
MKDLGMIRLVLSLSPKYLWIKAARDIFFSLESASILSSSG